MAASFDLGAFFFGMFVGIFIFAFLKCIAQTLHIYKHKQSFVSLYLCLLWGEGVCNLVFAVTTILFLNEVIPPTHAYFATACTLWAIQVELLPQIIANRVAIIMIDQRRAKQLKWGLAGIITPVCGVVLYVWTVGHFPEATLEQQTRNFRLEICEKIFFLLVDLSLNLYFLYLVRFRLIAYGLTKYWKLFNYNVVMVVISTTFDALLLGFINLPNPYIYVQFAPLAYISKLYIELEMANLIFKVVRSSSTGNEHGWVYGSSHNKSQTGTKVNSNATAAANKMGGNTKISRADKDEAGRLSSSSELELASYPGPHGITRTVETTVITEDQEGGSGNTGSAHNRTDDYGWNNK
ncbi:hypothetical protein SLS62_001116 [Diatrype stigma]|uniref:Uncharacterized protein n=1 Tax=Diatrype stigma TaxID=117547 RepID=A0AAN9UWC8_9PEZI